MKLTCYCVSFPFLYQEGDDYVWFVSSDSEPPSSEPVSQQVTMATVKDEDIVIQPKEGEPAVKKAQKKKSPKKKANSDRQSPKKEDSAQEILKTEGIISTKPL